MTLPKNANIPVVTASLDSSLLKEAEYDPFMNVLSIRFKNGMLYEYINVSQEVFEDLKNAASPGQYFHLNIKGKFDFLKKGNSK